MCVTLIQKRTIYTHTHTHTHTEECAEVEHFFSPCASES